MKIGAGVVGTSAGPLVHDIDARWLMAYAAALGDTDAAYLDTTRPGSVVGHPLFAVCYEWPLACELRTKTMPDHVLVRGVHATHDLRLHRRARAGDRLSTTAAILSVEPRRSGAYVLTRLQTVDAGGRPVSTTDYGSIYRGVECDRDGATDETGLGRAPAGPAAVRGHRASGDAAGSEARGTPDWSEQIAIAPTLAHVYTECARIWNPIHTDRAVARAAGLPDIILHGTATLALAVSRVLAREPAGAAARVARIACRFGAMVPLPSTIQVQAWRAATVGGQRTTAFDARDAEGRAVLRDGRVEVTTSPDPEESSR